MDVFLFFLLIGTVFACALSLLAIALSRRHYRNLKLSREVASLTCDIADVTEKIEHQSKLFKKINARLAQRERREKERTSGDSGEGLSGEEWKKEWRRKNLDKITLNQRR